MGSITNGIGSFQNAPDKEFTSDLTVAGTDINWASGFYKEITLTANTTFTFSNLKKGKTIVLRLTGSFAVAFPSICELVNAGTYDGTKYNYIFLSCFSPTRVLLTINKTA